MTDATGPMLWLLDTCVMSELTRPEPNAAVHEWLAIHASHCAWSAAGIGEIQYGLLRLPASARNWRLLACSGLPREPLRALTGQAPPASLPKPLQSLTDDVLIDELSADGRDLIGQREGCPGARR